MELEATAKQAYEYFSTNTNVFKSLEQKNAILGFLRGVQEGNITVGQSWMANVLLNINSIDGVAAKQIQDVFASGMCCEGQQLSSKSLEKGKGFVDRSVRGA